MPLRQISFHIVHPEAVLAAGLHALLDGQPGLRPAPLGEADVLLTDYDHALRHAGQVAARILLLTQRDSECELRRALDGGVHGYLLQSCSAEELRLAVRQLGRGQPYLSPALRPGVADGARRAHLTGRETDVLRLLALGRCDKAIARELGIGLGTVKTHVKGVLSKLDATARTHAVVVAAQRGLIAVRPPDSRPQAGGSAGA
ncbi:response regulator transcription factor [Massilia sp. BJB1822]|uniref:LuxR C-terminal-related transcriptional regulator n=1 Tax=Massilia sp. BJB1822 TaxID=2744470 RepID=UPI001592E005|nr:response regulator transcription factor [Massilia sp. BJB1822]NVD98069.1 response regulator transcription factor [Massilia sp. BJB1822]